MGNRVLVCSDSILVAESVKSHYTASRIPPMIYQFVTLCLVIGRAKRIVARRTRLESRLLSVLVQDQVLYFLAYVYFRLVASSYLIETNNSVIVSGCTSIMAYWIDDDNFRSAASGFAYAIPCIIGSRLLVNLKEVAEQDSLYALGGARGTLSGMVFGVAATSNEEED